MLIGEEERTFSIHNTQLTCRNNFKVTTFLQFYKLQYDFAVSFNQPLWKILMFHFILDCFLPFSITWSPESPSYFWNSVRSRTEFLRQLNLMVNDWCNNHFEIMSFLHFSCARVSTSKSVTILNMKRECPFQC